MPSDTFPVRVRAARLAAGLTQTDLAERLGVTKARISQIELGTYAATPETVVAVAEALGVEPDALDPSLTKTTAWTRPG